MPILKKVVSGGQTGADQGGLDGAISRGIPHGGCCPRGRRSEAGRIPAKYKLIEASSSSYPERTRLNVENSDGTIIFTMGPITPGLRLTFRVAREASKPCLHIDLLANLAEGLEKIREWIVSERIEILNVAGTRESKAPGIQERVADVVRMVLPPKKKPKRARTTNFDSLTEILGM